MRKALRGYIVSGNTLNPFIPQRVQNLVIRDYCESNSLDFLLSSTEFSFEGSDQTLKSLLKKDESKDGIVFYSIDQFIFSQKILSSIEEYLSVGKEVHFALEEKKLASKKDLKDLSGLIKIKALSNSPSQASSISDSLLRIKDFVTPLHKSSKRDYLERVTSFNKADCAIIAKEFGKDYWDGERQFGYGGYSYDGRWKEVAEKLIKNYALNNKSSVLDIGCGKGYLLFELKKILPDLTISGIDISDYAIKNAKEEVKEFLSVGDASKLPYKDKQFDLVISNTTFHNFTIDKLFMSLAELERVKKGSSWICVESYRNELEKMNLLYWQLTCDSFYSTEEWIWLFNKAGYSGDFEFIYFE